LLFKKMISTKGFLLKIWYRMPIDGVGIIRLGPRSSKDLQTFVTRYRWSMLPIWLRPFGFLVIRFAWLFICPVQALIAFRRSRQSISWRTVLRAIWLGWTRGKSPFLFIAAYPSIGTGHLASYRREMLFDQLDDLQGGVLLASLAGKNDILLASDKLKSTRALQDLNLPVAPILIELSHATLIDFSAWPWADYKKLFIKPRAGFSSKGAMSVEKIAKNQYKINGSSVLHSSIINEKDFFLLLRRQLSKSNLIVQPFLSPSSTTFDISEKTPVLLRIFVYQSPGAPPQHLSSALKVQPPGKDAESNINRMLMAPIEPDSGILLSGVFVNNTDEKFSHVPWNKARLEGRFVPEFKQSLEYVLHASTLFPHVPLLGWDVLLSDQGPIILEANIGVSLSRAQLWHYEKGIESPLIPALLEWTKVKTATLR
jgi:hypothetical protein